jgi:hypothetical protein
VPFPLPSRSEACLTGVGGMERPGTGHGLEWNAGNGGWTCGRMPVRHFTIEGGGGFSYRFCRFGVRSGFLTAFHAEGRGEMEDAEKATLILSSASSAPSA